MPTDADRFARKAEAAETEAERAAWLAAAAAAGERDGLRKEVDALTVMCVLSYPEDYEYWSFVGNFGPVPYRSLVKSDNHAEAVAAVRRAAGLDTGGGSDG